MVLNLHDQYLRLNCINKPFELKRSTVIGGIILSLAVASCDVFGPSVYFENTEKDNIRIEILRPADTIVNPSVHNVLFFVQPGINTLLAVTPGKEQFVSLPESQKLDSACLYSMADLLSGSPRFTLMEPEKLFEPANGHSYNWNEIDTLCAQAGVDGCLILSALEVEIAVNREVESYNRGEGYYATGKFRLSATWRFYDPAKQNIISKIVRVGNSFEGSITEYPEEAFLALADFKSMSFDFASQAGEDYAKWIAPYWELTDRYIYLSGNHDMEIARNYADSGKWSDALSIWRKYRGSEKVVVAKHASFNSIVAYEVLDQLDSALNLANDTYRKFGTVEANDYAVLLEDRIREKQMVERQLGIMH